MPQIRQFFGTITVMHFNDHAPAHFHATYGEHEAVYMMDTLEIVRGRLPRRAHGVVVEWATPHRTELRDNWEKARQMVPLQKIDPLD